MREERIGRAPRINAVVAVTVDKAVRHSVSFTRRNGDAVGMATVLWCAHARVAAHDAVTNRVVRALSAVRKELIRAEYRNAARAVVVGMYAVKQIVVALNIDATSFCHSGNVDIAKHNVVSPERDARS